MTMRADSSNIAQYRELTQMVDFVETEWGFDEEFDGQVWALAVPKAVVDLSEDVAAWEQANGDAARSPMQSESFGGYSYSKGGSSSECPSWREAFRGELGRWRRL